MYEYSGYGSILWIMFMEFGNEFARDVIIFGVNNSLSSHTNVL